jgi:uncharacterized phage infection (PIP) family protein YhgE
LGERITVLEAERETRERQVKGELTEAAEKWQAQQKAAAVHEKQIVSLQIEVDAPKRDNARLSKAVHHAEGQHTRLLSDLEQTQQNLDNERRVMQNDLTAQHMLIDQLKAEKAALALQVREATAERDRAVAELGALQTTEAALLEQSQGLAAQSDEMKRLRVELSAMHAQLRNVQAANEAQNAELKKQHKTIEEELGTPRAEPTRREQEKTRALATSDSTIGT